MSILKSITSISKLSKDSNSSSLSINNNSLINNQTNNENQYWLSRTPTVTFISIYNIFRIPAIV